MSAHLTLGDAQALLTEWFLRQFDTPGPRCTSDPTADRFNTRIGPAAAMAALEANAATSPRSPISLYVHTPFREQLCYYGGCNKIITKHHERAAEYLDALETELALVAKSLGSGRPETSAVPGRPSCPTQSWAASWASSPRPSG